MDSKMQPGMEVVDRGTHSNWYYNSQVRHDYEGPQIVPELEKVTNHHPAPKRKILGIDTLLFWIMIMLLVVILAGGIGAGVAAGLTSKKHITSVVSNFQPQNSTFQTSSSEAQASKTSSGTSSSTSSEPSGPSPAIRSPCTNNPSVNGSILTATDATGGNTYLTETAHTFTLLCNTNYPAGSVYANPEVVDLMRIYTSDMAGCIDACVAYNLGYVASSTGGMQCEAVAVVKTPGDFCYLKSSTGTNDTTSSGGAPIDTAVLIH